jgi:hypothetical protein
MLMPLKYSIFFLCARFCLLTQARDGEEREKWVRHLEETISRSSNRYRGCYDASQTLLSMGGSSSSKNNYLMMFDKKVSEADTYLQMIIDQTTKVEQRIDALESEEDRAKYEAVKMQANEMLDHIKHSIVLLQIAKVERADLRARVGCR